MLCRIALIVPILCGCTFIDPIDDLGTSDDANECPGSQGPRPVRVQGEFGQFCVDSTEVTVEQYSGFVEAMAGDTTGQIKACQWNVAFDPENPPGEGEQPVVWVDWCDAYRFCQWAGKRLCSNDEWYFACSFGGTRDYPYAPEFDAQACVMNAAPASAPVKSALACEGGFPGIFDMSGNAAEWTDACDDVYKGPNDKCAVRGGSYRNVASEQERLACSTIETGTRGLGYEYIGFRCCS